jgi:hypothetical protein
VTPLLLASAAARAVGAAAALFGGAEVEVAFAGGGEDTLAEEAQPATRD